jgi:hypothetical protein
MTSDKCPQWCTSDRPDQPHEHCNSETRRSGYAVELLRYWGDDITRVTILEAMDGGQAATLPLDVLIDLMGEVRGKVAVLCGP